MKQVVVGVVGPIASGKGELVKTLEIKGFARYSLSERIREELVKQGFEETRENLQDMGDKLRHRYGDDALVLSTLEKVSKSGKRVVIESIRNPAEIVSLRQYLDAFILGISASQEKRFEHILARGRDGDPETWEEFKALDDREIAIQAESSQQVEKCLKMADRVIQNEGTLEDLRESIEGVLQDLGIEGVSVDKERET